MVEAMGGGLIQWLCLVEASKLANILYSSVDGMTYCIYGLFIHFDCHFFKQL